MGCEEVALCGLTTEGLNVGDIQWRMRLRHQHTLSYYLQEVAAINSLLAAGSDARHTLQCSAQLFPFLAASG